MVKFSYNICRNPPYAKNIGARFIVHILNYMIRPQLVAIFRWFVIKKIKNKTSTDICCVRRFLHILVDTRATGCITQRLKFSYA
jgi:hypothetical protein